MFKFNLGQHVRDVVNGFEGFVVSRAEYVTGCRQYGVESPDERSEGSQLHRWIDEIRLRATPRVAVAFGEPVTAPGGPVSYAAAVRMRVGLVALAEHTRDLESRAARAEAFDDEFRDTLCAAIFAGDARALDWLEAVAKAHRASLRQSET